MTSLTITDIRHLNQTLTSSHENLTAVFVGATNGIGLGTLEVFVRYIKKPRVVLVGRSKAAFSPSLEKIKQINANVDATFIEADVGLLRNVDEVCKKIESLVEHINLLFLSAGYINFGARDENEDGFDKCQALRYHTRLRFIVNLLPLMHAPYARIMSIFAAGDESDSLDYTDLELRKPGAYTLKNAGYYASAMTTLMFEKFARENPNIGFIHIHPGLVKSNVLNNSFGNGILGWLFKWIVTPILGLFFRTTEDSGERMLCYATSDKVAGPAVEGQSTLRLAQPTVAACWILGWDGKTAGNEKALTWLRESDGEKKVWEHTQAEWKRVLG